MMFLHFALALGLNALVSAQATVYFIRHGEKPSSGNGLSSQGEERAQCLRSVFGSDSQYNIGYVMAQAYKSGRVDWPVTTNSNANLV